MQGSEQPIEKGETNAEVRVHESAVVQNTMVNVVQSASPAEPMLQQRCPLHPKALDVHAVVQIAEYPHIPGEHDSEKEELVGRTNAEKPEQAARGGKQSAGGQNPLQSDVSQGGSACGRVKILSARTLLLLWSVENQVMFHMVRAQEGDPPTVQEPVQEVPKEFRK